MRSGIFVVAVMVVGCGRVVDPPLVACQSRFDCADDETCTRGQCMPGVHSRMIETPPPPDTSGPPPVEEDAGVAIIEPDAGMVMTSPDAGVIASSDAGTSSAPDATAPDSGVIVDAGCMFPMIEVEGGQRWCTIAQGIAAAPEGGTVRVPLGLFRENLHITRAVTLEGGGSGLDFTPFTGISGMTGGAPVIEVDADNVVIRGFSIDATNAIGADLDGVITVENFSVGMATGTAIHVGGGATTNVTFTHIGISTVFPDSATTYGHGIVIDPGSTVTIDDATIMDTQALGILSDAATLTVRNSELLRCGRRDCIADEMQCHPAIYGRNGTTVVEAGTYIDNSGFSGVLHVGGNLTFRNSTSTNNGANDTQGGDGVLLDGTTSAVIENSTLSDNNTYGVACFNNPQQTSCTNNTHTNNGLGWTQCGNCSP